MKNLKKTLIASANWLSLDLIDYVDNHGTKRQWETVSRKKCDGAVFIIAKLVPSDRYILIRQYRPPAGKEVLEFPAGLVNPGEDASESAVRELQEETGYTGKVLKIHPPVCSSPGLTGESLRACLMEIDENDPSHHGNTKFDDTEDIATFLIPEKEFRMYVEKTLSEGQCAVDEKVLSFALGMK